MKKGVSGRSEYGKGVGTGETTGGVLVGVRVGVMVGVGALVSVQRAGKVTSGVIVGGWGEIPGRSVGGGKGLKGR